VRDRPRRPWTEGWQKGFIDPTWTNFPPLWLFRGYAELFTEDALLNYADGSMVCGYNVFQLPVGRVGEVVEYLSKALSIFSKTQHMMSNIDIDFDPTDPTKATVTTMFHNPMVVVPWILAFNCGGWYQTEMVLCEDGAWRAFRLKQIMAYHGALDMVPRLVLYGVVVWRLLFHR